MQPSLQLRAQAERERRRRLKSRPPAPPLWTPNPGPQTLAYHSPADELFYGGSAGGGKTDLILGIAGTAQKTSIVFRRVFPSIRNIIERSREIYNRIAAAAAAKDSLNEQLHIWRLSDKRQIEFGSLQYEKDKENYRGRPHDFYGWDEVTEFTETQFRFVNAWNRTTLKTQRCRIVATGNPPTLAAGRWVVDYWGAWLNPKHPRPAAPGELRWYARVGDKDVERPDGTPFEYNGELVTPRSRTFIPARLDDNPFLKDSGYRATLQALPEPLRSQMLYGEFGLTVSDDPYQTIPTAWVQAAQARWTAYAGPHTALGVDVARGGQDQTVIAARSGAWFAPLVKLPGAQTPDGNSVAQAVVAQMNNRARVNVDVIGVGASAYDFLRQAGQDVIGVNFGEGAGAQTDRSGRLQFRNVRAAAYWQFREALDPDAGQGLALPDDPELLADLCAAKWELSGGKIAIESKDDIKARLGRSPDCADAVVLAWYGAAASATADAWIAAVSSKPDTGAVNLRRQILKR